MKKVRELLKRKDFRKEDVASLLAFIFVAVIFSIALNFFSLYLFGIGYVVLIILLSILFLVAWFLAGQVVMKSLFLVAAELSLLIFLAQSYCVVPNRTSSADNSLKILLASGVLYVGFYFLSSLYREMADRSKKFREINNGKRSWVLFIPFALFTGLFVFQVYQVITPIFYTLCVYVK